MRRLIWDFDGTLANSFPLIKAGMLHALERLQLSPTVADQWLQYVGLPVEEGIKATFKNYDLSSEQIVEAYRSFPYGEFPNLITPFEGIPELLKDLHGLGCAMSIATSKRRTPLMRELTRFDWVSYFEIIITPDDLLHTKPHPESLEKIMKFYNAPPEDFLMIGDTSYDLEMARSSNISSVAVGYGFHSRQILMNSQPIAFANNVPALRDILLAYV